MLNDKLKSIVLTIERSHLFIALCASLLAIQSFVLTGHEIAWTSVALAFFATLAVYNLSVITVAVSQQPAHKRIRLNIDGDKLNLIFFTVSSIGVLLLLPGCNHFQALIFLLISLLSLGYMMPVKFNQKRLPGVRHHWIVKNILLSLIWSLATVLIPLSGDIANVFETEMIFVVARNFFFIYALTVIYDLRDLRADSGAGMKTLAMVTGVAGARVVALLSLTVFAILAFADRGIESGYHLPLMMSFLAAAVVVMMAGPARKRSFYLWTVDGMMALKALLVIMLH